MGGKVPEKEEGDDWATVTKKRTRHSVHTVSKFKDLQKQIGMGLTEDGKLTGMPDVWAKLLQCEDIIAEESVVDTESLPDEVTPTINEKVIDYVKQTQPGKFIVSLPTREQEEIKGEEVELEVDENTEEGLVGLTPELKADIKEAGLTKQDVIDDPMSVLETLTLMRRQKTGSIHPLPTNSEYRRKEKENIVFIKSDPSKDYIILNEIGEGGFGKVYR